MNKGKFIIIEGGEGSGKSTIVRYVVEKLSSQGISVISTREPGGSEVAENIRRAFIQTKLNPVSQLFCFLAARATWVEQFLKPKLKQSSVITDRSYPSTIVYQGIVGGIGEATVNKLNRLAMLGINPDMVIVLDVEAQEGLRRSRSTGDINALEAESLEFHKKVNKNYKTIAKKYKWPVIDAMKPLTEVKKEVLEYILNLLGKD